MRCVSTVPADCYEVYFDSEGEAGCLSRLTPDQWGLENPDAFCGGIIAQYLQQVGGSLRTAQHAAAMRICHDEINGRASSGSTSRYIDAQIGAGGGIPIVIVPEGPKVPWALLAVAAVGVVLYNR